MDQGPDHIGVDLWRGFKAFEAAMFDRVARLGFDDITVTDSDVLVQIGPLGQSMVQIASGRGVSKQAIQGQVRSLVQRGYVRIEPDPNDARAKRVMHTDKGRALVAALVQVKTALHAEVADLLGPDDLAQLRKMLDAIANEVAP
ncbi:MarR family winged helix-turn-helix transcriptional regulator [uncultured Tateyamaria sp.]|uniref:MarR family winged helix-turn-helix transcriptional regulator n=1 Tax=uncultured Tateyamaria sp. TaxID=455651 RepID=UPI0026309523|nr:MarR family winged helix-turn-helix transcriptional regulator [uncultured Tateyamaria sp.]